MTDVPGTPVPDDVALVRESARRLGIELDEVETDRWIAAIAATSPTGSSDVLDVVVDLDSGVFGHRVSMLDFSPREIARFREIGRIVEVTGPDGVAEGALALSGSAAQSKIQTHPGDADFFQRLNIRAPSRDEAATILARLLRDHALAHAAGETYEFLEAKWGNYPFDCERDGVAHRAGTPVSWSPAEVRAGEVLVRRDGTEHRIAWDDLAADPGWCKLDWVVIDPVRHRLTAASNVIDPTWESPDGEVVALDGYLDAYFQEVYLDAEDLPTFTKIVQHVSGDALDEYVAQLEKEVAKYLTGTPNYGKAAKRMYNVFRLTGRHLDAAFVRELFDEPTTLLYQVWSLISTLDKATTPGSTVPVATVHAQTDELVLSVVHALEGVEEDELVSALLRLRDSLSLPPGEVRSLEVSAAQDLVVNLVNNFFHDRLSALPTIREYMDRFGTA
jgi:hypothetical protein